MRINAVSADNLADRVLTELRDVIARESLCPGDALPGEIELASRLGVSRNVVREATSRLRMLGVIESRKRRGMVVSHPKPFAGMQASLIPQLLDATDVRELMQMRIMLELGMAEYLCANVTDEDIVELKEIAAKENRAARGSDEQVAFDIAFHAKLYRITGNRSVEQFQELLSRFFAEARRNPKPPLPKTPWHKDIAAALESRNPDTVRTVLRNHLAIHIQLGPKQD